MDSREASLFDLDLHRLSIIIGFGSRINRDLDAIGRSMTCADNLKNQLTKPTICTDTKAFERTQARPLGLIPRTIKFSSSESTSASGAPIR